MAFQVYYEDDLVILALPAWARDISLPVGIFTYVSCQQASLIVVCGMGEEVKYVSTYT